MSNDAPPAWGSRVRQVLGRASSWFLITAILLGGSVLLGTVWVSVQETRTARQLSQSALEAAADTYESQLIRSLREIDQSLRIVVLQVEHAGVGGDPIAQLRSRGLLLPEQIFNITLASETEPPKGRLAAADGLVIDPQSHAGASRLSFSRPVPGRAPLRAVLEVDASYFVAAYDTERLGHHGLVSLSTLTGVTLARHGDLPAAEGSSALRRELFGYPVVAMVAQSEAELLAPLHKRHRIYGGLCGLVLIVIAAVTSVLWRQRRWVERERERHGQLVQRMAFRDALTDLPNRYMVERILEDLGRGAQQGEGGLAVLFLDLDGFKAINDRHGHEVGDGLLRSVARRLESCVRPGDTVARLGGDEFVVLLTRTRSADDALKVARRIVATIGQPHIIDGCSCGVTTSIGIATQPGSSERVDDLMHLADQAMYEAKMSGKNDVRIAAGAAVAHRPPTTARRVDSKTGTA